MAATKIDPRVQDYLNDKFQALRDLDTLDTLLLSVQTQQSQLRSQLQDASTAAFSSRTRLVEHSNALQHTASTFEQSQVSIDRRLLAVSGEAGQDAEAAFGEAMEKLRRVMVAQGYIELLQRVQGLVGKVDVGEPEKALGPYAELRELASGLRERNEAAEGAAVHLVEYVDSAAEGLWGAMKSRLAAGLEAVLGKAGWPAEGAEFEKVQKEFAAAFQKLLVLQRGAVKIGEEGEPLIAFQVLTKSLTLRFRYHFEGERPTNRIDKPEWFLAHLSTLASTHAPFLAQHVQPLLPDTVDAIAEFITALLPALRRKIAHLLPQITDQAPLLSHFIHELLKFDAELRSTFSYAPAGSHGPWKGVTHEVLVTQGHFGTWLATELEFATQRYTAITTAVDAWDLDADTGTRSALRLKDLLESVADSYRPLISFSQRLRFLLDIHLHLLDLYHARLAAALDAFAVLNSGIARAVSGASAAGAPDPAEGLARLCKVHGSALFLESAMRDWGEDVFFLELWEDLSTRATKSATVAGSSVREVAAATSATLTDEAVPEEDGALFDETAAAYAKLRARAETLLSEVLTTAVRDSLRSYTSAAHPGAVPLDLSTLSTHLSFLHSTLPRAAFRRVYRPLANALGGLWWDGVLLKHQWNAESAAGLRRDVEELWQILSRVVEEPRRGMEKVSEGVNLLCLGGGDDDGEGTQIGLKEVVKDVFEDNEKARKMIARLGLQGLTVQEVRSVLQRKVDAWA